MSGCEAQVTRPVFGIDDLRAAARLFSNCSETFNQRFTAEQLIAIYQAYVACEWDISPDRWPEAAISAACDGSILAAAHFVNEHFAAGEQDD